MGGKRSSSTEQSQFPFVDNENKYMSAQGQL